MNLDMTYCDGNDCKIKENCRRWIGNYEVPENTMLWMMSGSDGDCIDYSPIESEEVDG